MKRAILLLALCVLVVIFAACAAPPTHALPPPTSSERAPTGLPAPPTSSGQAPTITASPSVTPTALRDAARLDHSVIANCPVTLPNIPDDKEFNLGNPERTLFTIPWPDGIAIFARKGPGFVGADGSLAMKWPWDRRGVSGEIQITGKRLDTPSALVPRIEQNDSYGKTGWTPSSLIFPSPGCWEITARVADASLTFVTMVIKTNWKFVNPVWLPEGLVSASQALSDMPHSYANVYDFGGSRELRLESTEGEWDDAPFVIAEQGAYTVNGIRASCLHSPDDEGALVWSEDNASYRVRYKNLGLNCLGLVKIVQEE